MPTLPRIPSERKSDAALIEAAMLGDLAPAVTLVIPHGTKRHLELRLPAHIARWLHDQLGEALALPRPQPRRRPVRIRRGRWIRGAAT